MDYRKRQNFTEPNMTLANEERSRRKYLPCISFKKTNLSYPRSTCKFIEEIQSCPILKWAKEMNGSSLEIELSLKHMRRCSQPLSMRELYIKSAMRCHLKASFWPKPWQHPEWARCRKNKTLTGCRCCRINFVNLFNLSGEQFINISQNYKGSTWPRNSTFSNLSKRCDLTGVKWHMYKAIHCHSA